MPSLKNVVALFIAGAAMQAQTVTWVRAGSPSPRCCAGFAYDGATQSTVLFGGANQSGDSVFGDTWTWRGGWLREAPATAPSPRQGTAMAFDGATGAIVLFGGSTTAPVTPGSSLADTWTWDGATWTQQFPPISPPARTWATMAYVPATKSVMLFGGNNMSGGDGPLDDTWTWDGNAKTWTQQHPTSQPSARGSAPAVYDEATRSVLLFGGVTTNLTTLNDTWTWDGINWRQHSPALSPAPRCSPGMAYDPDLRAVVLFGGAVGTNCTNNLNDTWTWDGLHWTQIYPADGLPNGRNGPVMDYDFGNKAVLLFGGSGNSGRPLGDTWLLNLAP